MGNDPRTLLNGELEAPEQPSRVLVWQEKPKKCTCPLPGEYPMAVRVFVLRVAQSVGKPEIVWRTVARPSGAFSAARVRG